MSASLIELYRLGHKITLADKINTAATLLELQGMEEQIAKDGRTTDETTGLIATRRAELQRK